jgi:hypothetical protein
MTLEVTFCTHLKIAAEGNDHDKEKCEKVNFMYVPYSAKIHIVTRKQFLKM